MTYRAVRSASLPSPGLRGLNSIFEKDFMGRLSTLLIAAAMGATLAVGCSSPTDENVTGATRPVPGGDGTVARLGLPGGPLRIAAAPEGFAYITLGYFAQAPGPLARVGLNTSTISAS